MRISKMSCVVFFTLLPSVLFSVGVMASEFYVDPVKGSMSGDGSQAHPWSTLEDVWKQGKIETRDCSTPCSTTSPEYVTKNATGAVKSGDTIYLMSGYHGTLSATGAYNSDWITIKAYPGQTPTLKNVFLKSASKWSFEGLSISPSHAPVFVKVDAIFKIEDHNWTGPSDHITLKDSSVFSVPDSSVWVTKEDWINNASSGIISNGDYTLIENVTIKNVAQGVSFYQAHHSILKNSTIDHICHDGLWVFGSDYAKAEYNTIKNIIAVLNYSVWHYDLIQDAITDGVPQRGVEIRGNILISAENSSIPFINDSSTQGIGFFDGWFEDYVIENNLVVVTNYHGISVYGARNSRIINNTVVVGVPYTGSSNTAPIGIYDHKDGTAGYGNIIRNNICTALKSVSSGTVADHNTLTSDKVAHFVDPDHFDFRLKKTSTAINAGAIELAPTIDLKKAARDSRPDIGAYEYLPGVQPPVNFTRQN